MPSKSPAQAKLMRAVAHGWKPDRMKGPPKKVAKEFVAADKKAKGYQRGGTALRLLREARDTRTSEERWREKYGTEPLTLRQASERVAGRKVTRMPTARRELQRAGWTEGGDKWYPPESTIAAPTEGGLAAATEPVRTIQPIPGRDFIAGAAPERRRAPEDIAPGFQPGRVPPALVAYLQSLQGGEEEPVKMQFGGAMRGLRNRGRRGFGRNMNRGLPPGGGGLARAAVQPGGGMMTSDMGMRAGQARRGQPGQGWSEGPRGGVGQGQPRPQPPGAGVPMRGVGRPPGMGRPGAGGGAGKSEQAYRDFAAQQQPGQRPPYRPSVAPPGAGGGPGMPGRAGDYQRNLQQRKQQATGGARPAVMPGGQFMNQFRPGGGGAGMPGGANRIGMGDQQGAQARAMQVQTGRPPMSRRMGFGRGRRRRGGFR